MKLKPQFKSLIIDVICMLFVLLFVYAAISKLLDFENFQIQIGQSPLLSAYAEWVSWLVPLAELLIALFLLIYRLRIIGLFMALSLMTLFSVYIFIILHFSEFVPCSCGGVLEKMSWNVHLAFNMVFVILACLAIILRINTNKIKILGRVSIKVNKVILLTILISTAVIIALFLSSEDIIHNKNPFIRRFPHHPVMFEKSIDLKFNSYYFAGSDNNRIYLGNYTAPLKILSIDSKQHNIRTVKIAINSNKTLFSMVRIKIKEPYFYLMDGTVPAVFRGKTSDWKISRKLEGIPYYTLAEPADSTSMIFRSGGGPKGSHRLGVYTEGQIPADRYNNHLLQTQIDGVFDTDGMLVFSEKLNKMVYVYYYRNEFIVALRSLKLNYRGHTIDTTAKAKIKVAYLKNKTIRKMAAPPLLVNAHSAVWSNLLFVNSKIRGKLEDEKLWKNAFIIDVYDLKKNSYLMSFSVHKIEDKKFLSFFVTGEHLYVLMENELAVYKLRDVLKKEINNVGIKNF